jgi:hypothetical protein
MLAALCVVVLLGLWTWWREKHLRRLAEAKLEIAKGVTQLDKLMLEGKIKMGELCHDELYRALRNDVYNDRFVAPLRFLTPPGPGFREFRTKLQKELEQQNEVRHLVRRHMFAEMKAFRNAHPYVWYLFVLWVLICAGGIGVLWVGLKSAQHLVKVWGQFKELAAESYLSLEQSA